jgi:hypothetical protein
MAELQRRARITADKGLLDRRLMRRHPSEDLTQPFKEVSQAKPEPCLVVRDHRAAGNEDEPGAVMVDDPPAGAPQSRIDANNADGLHAAGSLPSPVLGRLP